MYRFISNIKQTEYKNKYKSKSKNDQNNDDKDDSDSDSDGDNNSDINMENNNLETIKIVEQVFEYCYQTADFKHTIGIVIEYRRIDRVKQAIQLSGIYYSLIYSPRIFALIFI